MRDALTKILKSRCPIVYLQCCKATILWTFAEKIDVGGREREGFGFGVWGLGFGV